MSKRDQAEIENFLWDFEDIDLQDEHVLLDDGADLHEYMNPYHDEKGRFDEAPGGGGGSLVS